MIQACLPEDKRITIDEFICTAIDSHARYCIDNCEPFNARTADGLIERGTNDSYWIYRLDKTRNQKDAVTGLPRKRISVVRPRLSGVHPSGDEVRVLWSELSLGKIRIVCQIYEHPYLGFIERYLYAYDDTSAKHISFEANRMRILEMIPINIFADINLILKVKTLPGGDTFTLFPCNFPFQPAMLLPRMWMMKYCDFAAIGSHYSGTPLSLDSVSIILPHDIGAITDEVAAAVEGFSLRHPSNLLIELATDPTLNQDEIDVVMKIILFLGIEIMPSR